MNEQTEVNTMLEEINDLNDTRTKDELQKSLDMLMLTQQVLLKTLEQLNEKLEDLPTVRPGVVRFDEEDETLM